MSTPREIAPGVHWMRFGGSNVYFVRSGSSWVLIDTAWENSAPMIRYAAERLFGNSPPVAIFLTHSHPDHAGSARELARRWDTAVYLHPDELPLASATDLATIEHFANPLDNWLIFPLLRTMSPRQVTATMARTSLKGLGRAFDPDAGLPGLPGWRSIPTPGHTPGHVAFFREKDRALLTGDACLTAGFRSLWGLLTEKPVPAPAPRISSWSWPQCKASVRALAELEPRVVGSGHGVPMIGEGVARQLHAFAERFAGGC
jgi:glyoxylase-like metal-dependent hydrolase (beta-lactamase superfamily II)